MKVLPDCRLGTSVIETRQRERRGNQLEMMKCGALPVLFSTLTLLVW